MVEKLPIRWDEKATDSLKDIYDSISLYSPSQAKIVAQDILELAASLNHFPKKYSKEPYLAELPNDYRSVSKWSYKLIYEVAKEAIIIVMLFDGRQNPEKIKRFFE